MVSITRSQKNEEEKSVQFYQRIGRNHTLPMKPRWENSNRIHSSVFWFSAKFFMVDRYPGFVTTSSSNWDTHNLVMFSWFCRKNRDPQLTSQNSQNWFQEDRLSRKQVYGAILFAVPWVRRCSVWAFKTGHEQCCVLLLIRTEKFSKQNCCSLYRSSENKNLKCVKESILMAQ